MLDRDKTMIMLMLDHIKLVERYTVDHIGGDDFYEDDKSFNAAIFLISQIGEKTTRLSKSFLAVNDHIEWRAIKNFRNFVIHNYEDVDPEMVWEVISVHLPKLKKDLLDILQSE